MRPLSKMHINNGRAFFKCRLDIKGYGIRYKGYYCKALPAHQVHLDKTSQATLNYLIEESNIKKVLPLHNRVNKDGSRREVGLKIYSKRFVRSLHKMSL